MAITARLMPFTGEIAIMEVLVAPFRKKDIYVKAAYFRAEFNLRPPDAIHVASAEAAHCRYF